MVLCATGCSPRSGMTGSALPQAPGRRHPLLLGRPTNPGSSPRVQQFLRDGPWENSPSLNSEL